MRAAILVLTLVAACGFDRLPPMLGKSSSMQLAKTAGDQQTGIVGQTLANVLEITASDPATGTPIENLTIEFAVTTGSGSVADVSLRTDVAGKVRTRLTLDRTAGSNAVTASADDGADPVVFTELGVAGPAVKLVKGADPAPAVAGTTLADPIVVVVEDQFANPVAQAQVAFAVTAGNGSVSAPRVTSAGDGTVTTTWTLGTKAGDDRVTASIPSVTSVTFETTGLVGAAAQLVALRGENSNGQVASTVDFQVAVEDANGNGVAGVTVDFITTAGGGSVSPASAVTAPDGTVSTTLTLGTTPGANTVSATTGSLASVLHATATLGDPSKLVRVSPTGSPSATVGTTLAPFVVAVEDAQSNPVPGATVTFQVTQGSGSLSTTTATTDANGHAQTALTLDVKVGGDTVVATAGGLPTVTFTATGLAGPAAQIAILSGNHQSAQFGRALAAPLVVAIEDAHGNAVAGTTVSFAATAGGGSVSSASVVSDAQGHAETSLTVGATGGANTVTASVTGLGSVSFAATSTTFALAATPIQFFLPSRSIALVDLNADSKPDVVSGGDFGVSILMNETSGSLTFAPRIDVSAGTVHALGVADIDGDGKPDLVVANDRLSVLVNNTVPGSLAPQFTRTDISTSTGANLAIADINGDGRPDLVTGGDGTIVVAMNTTPKGGTPSFSLTVVSRATTKLQDSGTIASADLDGDGLPDILAGDSTRIDDQLTFLQNQTPTGASTPTFSARFINLASDRVNAIVPADLDGDGRMDVLVSGLDVNFGIGTLALMQTGPLTFTNTNNHTFAGVSAVVDLNGDGHPDPIFGPMENFAPFNFSVGVNMTRPGATSPLFASVGTISSGTILAMTAGDLNGDGRPDLVAGGICDAASCLFISLAQSP